MIEELKKVKNDYPMLYEELISRNLYERYYDVHDNDIVIDIGANIGAFSMKIIEKCSICYCIEPGNDEFEKLKCNLKNYTNKTIFSNEAISTINNEIFITSNNNNELILKTPYRDYIKKHKIYKIDFMKIDAEGAEWDIFIDENIDLLKNIEYIAGEFHIKMNGTGVEYENEKINKSLDILERYFYVKYTGVGGEIIKRNDIIDCDYHQFLIYAINKSNNKLNEWFDKIDKTSIEIRYMDGRANVSIFNNNKNYSINFINNGEILYSSNIINGWSMTNDIKDEWNIEIYDNDRLIINEIITKDNNFVLKTI